LIEKVIVVKTRKGFTLVELLIVIVIIGILASSMLLSSSSATASAEATNIISELRNLKAATMMLFADSMDEANAGTLDTFVTASASSAAYTFLGKYMDNPEKLSTLYWFKIGTSSGSKKWYVGFNLSAVTSEVKEKLQGKAKGTGLYGSANSNGPTDLSSNGIYDGEAFVWMVAR
jgi:prepilin-type N-terminal cleavage/methylation domain-containing protein